MNASGLAASSCDKDLITDTVGFQTIHASSKAGTRSIFVQSCRVGRGCHIADAGDAAWNIGYDFVHAGDH